MSLARTASALFLGLRDCVCECGCVVVAVVIGLSDCFSSSENGTCVLSHHGEWMSLYVKYI